MSNVRLKKDRIVKITNNNHDKQISFQFILKEILSAIGILIIIIVLTLIFVNINRDYIVVELIDVPDKLKSNGYTSKAIADKLINEINVIKSRSLYDRNISTINTNSQANYDIVIPGQSITIKSIIVSVKQYIRKPLFIVAGHIVFDGDKYKMMLVLRDSKRFTINNEFDYIVDKDNNIDLIIKNAASKVYVQIDPLIMAGYHFKLNDYKTVLMICENLMDESQKQSHFYLIWALTLYNTRRYDEALSKIEFAGKYNSDNDTNYMVYTAWGDILRKLRKFDESISKYNLAANKSTDLSYPYYMIGDVQILQGKYKIASVSLQKGIDIDNRLKINNERIQFMSYVVDKIPKLSDEQLANRTKEFNSLIVSNAMITRFP